MDEPAEPVVATDCTPWLVLRLGWSDLVPRRKTVVNLLSRSRIIAADDVSAFGDVPYDIELLNWASHGVSVANAHPDVLAAVDEITDSNDEDGVAAVLERLLA